jgi:hypothetical protein
MPPTAASNPHQGATPTSHPDFSSLQLRGYLESLNLSQSLNFEPAYRHQGGRSLNLESLNLESLNLESLNLESLNLQILKSPQQTCLPPAWPSDRTVKR